MTLERIPFLDDSVELVSNADGLVRIWEHPIPGERYFAGADVSEGIEGKGGEDDNHKQPDWSVVEVIKGSDCAQVAEVRVRMAATRFGKLAAYVAWYFNTAQLCFETHPAAYGLPANEAAMAAGYSNFYYREAIDTITKRTENKLGWATTSTTKPTMFERVQQALTDGHEIRSEALLLELLSIRWEQKKDVKEVGASNWKAVTRKHDDCHDAYAIALIIRDKSWVQRVEAAAKKSAPSGLQAAAWADAEAVEDNWRRQTRKKRVAY